jgi:REP element-mobilizing transposase RayT
MPRREIKFYAGEYYHIYNRGNSRQNIFFERENYLFFLRRVCRYLPHSGIFIVAYCLMPSHYHLMVGVRQTSEVSETSEVLSVSTGMMRLSVSYTKAINKRYQRSGVLFQGPFQAVHVDRNEYLLHLSRYIHLNPVAAGLVKRPEDWEFSSYRDYTGLRNGTLPETEIVLSQFPTRSAYHEFVASYSRRDEELIAHLLLD